MYADFSMPQASAIACTGWVCQAGLTSFFRAGDYAYSYMDAFGTAAHIVAMARGQLRAMSHTGLLSLRKTRHVMPRIWRGCPN